MQIGDQRAGDEAGAGGVTNAKVVAADDINDLVRSIKAVHLPVGDQAAGQAAGVELVLIVQSDFRFAADTVPDANVVE